MNTFSETVFTDVLQNIGALKNFPIFWIKQRLQHGYFPVSIAKFLRTVFLQNTSGGSFSIFLKEIKQPFRRGVNLNRFFKKCPCYDVLIIFPSQRVLENIVWYVELVCLCICYQLSGFLNNFVMVYPIKLKIVMLYITWKILFETPFLRYLSMCLK